MILNLTKLKDKYNLNISGIIHIGAHFGEEHKIYKNLGVKDIVYFEPVKKTFKVLEERIKDATLYNYALGNENKLIEMFIEEADAYGCSSILKPSSNYDNVLFSPNELVEMKRLDDFNFQNYNFLNIDVQGYEYEVLKGSEQTLNNIDYIMCEINREVPEKKLDYIGTKTIDKIIEFLKPYGFKLVETYYLGMEHQSAVSYGNKYENGYLGSDLSRTGIGMLFDFIIIHESGHEWFGNSITSKDIADMWIHEGFTCYSESVYLECQYGIEKAQLYINGLKKNIRNDEPIIAKYGVFKEGSGDMYYKGALMLNTIRHILNDDEKWWKIILEYSTKFKHKIIDTETVLAYFNEKTGLDLTSVFNQYLRHTSIPKLEMKIDNYKLCYRWKATEPNFEMPVDIKIKGEKIRINATSKWVKSRIVVESLKDIEIQKNDFLVN